MQDDLDIDGKEKTPSGNAALTQGCAIEWGDEDQETPGFAVSSLFQSPTPPRSTISTRSMSSGLRYPRSGSGGGNGNGTGTINTQNSPTLQLSTQPSKSFGKEQKVEEEVDYIFSMLDSKSATAAEKEGEKNEEEEVNDNNGNDNVQTPRVQNGGKRLSSSDLNSMLSGLKPERSHIAGAKQRRRRREMIEKKRLFRNSKKSSSNRERKKQKSNSNSARPGRVETESYQEMKSVVNDHASPFEDLLMELKAGSSHDAIGKTKKGQTEGLLIRSNGIDSIQEDNEKDSSRNCCHKDAKMISVVSRAATKKQKIENLLLAKQTESKQIQIPAPTAQQNDDFDDIDFDDDLFAAVDAAVLQRQTQLSQRNDKNENKNNQEAGIAQPNQALSSSLQRSQTLPTSNKSCDVALRRIGHDLNTASVPFVENSDEGVSNCMETTVSVLNTKHTNAVVQSSSMGCAVEDDFNDFPMLDFDAIDQLVAQRKSAKERHSSESSFITCTRYRVQSVFEDLHNFTKTLSVALWSQSDKEASKDSASGTVVAATNDCIHLHGEWFHTKLNIGDVIHLCSLNGKYNTDPSSLPIHLHTQGGDDDLVLILHPDQLVTPTTISETVTCLRRAILKTRYGSSGLTSRSALVGQMRHDLFEVCLLQNNFSKDFAQIEVPRIVREHGEQLIGAGLLNEKEMISEVVKIVPNIQRFIAMHTKFTVGNSRGTLPGVGNSQAVEVLADKIHGTEEFIVSTELGIKGFIDASVEALIRHPHGTLDYVSQPTSTRSIMGIELKTGHNQIPQHAHMAQLSLYTMALQTRYGSTTHSSMDSVAASKSGMLLYLNQENLNAVHVSPNTNELKSLLNQRNTVAAGLRLAAAPRGITIEYCDTNDEGKEEKSITIEPATSAALPDLLNSSFSCERCYSNRECMLNAAMENQESIERPKMKKTHAALLQHFTGHLDQAEKDYFKEWDRLVDLEASVMNKEITKAWLVPALERERSTGKTISSLIVDKSSLEIGASSDSVSSEFVVKCSRCSRSPISSPLNSSRFEEGSRVILSSDASSIDSASRRSKTQRKIFGISRGIVKGLDEHNIFIRLSHADIRRLLTLSLSNQEELLFRLDKDDFMAGTSTLRQNLLNLMTADVPPFSTKSNTSQETLSNTQHALTSRGPSLRRSIIHLDAPEFSPVSMNALFGSNKTLAEEYSTLNRDQKAAAYKVMTGKNYSLIQGFPGTGKTSTIVFIARLMTTLGKRVLVTSYTHAAVDNILLKLMDKGVGERKNHSINTDLVRVGSKSSIHPLLHKVLAPHLAGEMDRKHSLRKGSPSQDTNDARPSLSNLHEVISSAKIVGVSALTVPKSPLLIGQKFDLVIVDEAGQISQPAIIGALMAADSFLLVGDHEQLPPLVQSDVAEEAGYSVSMLKRLAITHPKSVAQLTLQYRMHEDICMLSNMLVYNGHLKCANDTVRRKKLPLPSFPRSLRSIVRGGKALGWLPALLNPNRPVLFVNTDAIGLDLEVSGRGHQKGNGAGLINDTEVTLTKVIAMGLILCGLDASSLGIISPYRAQVNRIEDDPYVRSRKGLEVSTIDKYQGRDKDAVVLSLVRSNSRGRSGRLLEDKRRLNVAFSRAKMKLIIIGSYNCLTRGSSVLAPVLKELKRKGWVETLPTTACETYQTQNPT